MLICDLTRAEIQVSLSNHKIKISDPEKRLTELLRRRIAANHDELVAYLTPKKVTRIKRNNPELLMVIQCCDPLVARAFGDGQPREPSAVTMTRITMPDRRAAPRI